MPPLAATLSMGVFEDRLFGWIESNGLLAETGRVLLAVSGGADSVAMAHALIGLKKQGVLSCDFVIGHVNHSLRGAASDGDEAFVERLGQSLGISVVTQRVDVRAYAAEQKLSIETAGRVLRLKTLARMAEGNGCDCIATAHHKDDLAETMDHRLMRGTGFRGLCGIWPVSEVYGASFVRPMLDLRRDEIIQYCRDNAIQWRHDASNENAAFTRNRIRHSLLPVLEAESEDLVGRLADLARAGRRFSVQTENKAQAVFNDAVSDNRPGRITLQKAGLRECPPWVFYELIRTVLVMLDVGLRDYTREHFKAIRSLMDQPQGNVSMPGPIQVFAEEGLLGFIKSGESAVLPSESIQLGIGQTVEFGPWHISSSRVDVDYADLDKFVKNKEACVEWFDADKITGPLEVRRRRDGDRFCPIGGRGSKKVGRFLIDAQLDSEVKKRAFIIKDAEKILWLAPVRRGEQAKVTPQTRRILEIRLAGRKPKSGQCVPR